ncbi:MAG: tetratricopeptide repeat protein [Saprospiraceae bacterium]|nr:tetratricopeptide repeat protein [Saprospiraceae bacterium]HMW38760.1 tetratricopeptide repeat protein [Saprospiraceae bacterium]HMX89039.1 tetratricopeptide repeat protein [Saprospiraceae bacterium]HMZ40935.1 tetratricopeptide repeat protein [Saprospiraceae bacterium]HNA64466.1 tetratricopeptide repeat protein [Saprospiraceae bacterium]
MKIGDIIIRGLLIKAITSLLVVHSYAQMKGATPISSVNGHQSMVKNTYAVVVGISDYQDKDIPDLRYADKDAEAFANYLKSPAGGSLDPDHLAVLTNQQATAGRIAEALDALIEKARKDDQVIIYFSGHGDVEGKKLTQPGFLLCWDAPSRVYMGGGTYSLSFLQEVVSTLSVQNQAKVLVVTDACHAGKLAGSQIGGAQLTTANLAKQYANEVKILSCQPSEYSLEGPQWGGGRGVFSYHLIDALLGLADRNNDGQITLGEIDRYLEDHVSGEAAPQSQVPILLGNKTDRIATVNASMLADLKKYKTGHMAAFAATESRGFEEEILSKADTSIKMMYKAFKQAVSDKRFLSPESDCAEKYYVQLSQIEILAPIYGIMKRNFAAALQDDAQQVLNTIQKNGLTSELLADKKAIHIYRNYPAYLERAAQLLGKDHYMYSTLQARKYYFLACIGLTKKEIRNSLFQALMWEPNMPHAYLKLIGTYSAAQKDSAEYYAGKALDLVPGWVWPLNELAWFYYKIKMPDKTDKILEQAYVLDTNSVFVWYLKGTFYSYVHQNKKAEYWFLKAIAANETNICFPCIHNSLGNVYFEMGKYLLSEQEYKKAIQLDSNFIHAYNGLASVYRVTQRYPESEYYCNKTIELDSNDISGLNSLAILYKLTKRFHEAEQLYIKVIKLDTTFAKAYGNLGNLLSAQGRYSEAEKQFMKAIQLDSTSPSFQSGLGNVFRGTGQYMKAEQQFKKVIQMDSTIANTYNNLGSVYNSIGRYVEAEKAFKKAIQLDTNFVFAYFNLGCTYSHLSQPEKAYNTLEISLQKGYKDYDGMQQDPELALLRDRKEQWNALMQKYFPEKFNSK